MNIWKLMKTRGNCLCVFLVFRVKLIRNSLYICCSLLVKCKTSGSMFKSVFYSLKYTKHTLVFENYFCNVFCFLIMYYIQWWMLVPLSAKAQIVELIFLFALLCFHKFLKSDCGFALSKFRSMIQLI